MKCRHFTLIFLSVFFCAFSLKSLAADWPKNLRSTAGIPMKVYEPQPESINGGILKIRAAVSLVQTGKSDPVFGVLWADISVTGNGNAYNWQSATVTNIKFPGDVDESTMDDFATAFKDGVSNWNLAVAKTEIQAKLDQNKKEAALAEGLNTSPPAIIYSQQPSMLISIDGEPRFEKNSDWNVEQVTNTPFTIIKTSDHQYFLYGNKRWYSARSVTGDWSYVRNVPTAMANIDRDVRARDTSSSPYGSEDIARIIVSTSPTELIQSDGEANFSPIQGTNLLYLTNSANDIFMDVNSQHYYVLISGRWFTSSNLKSGWTYTSADNLPGDFARIPAGSSKDNVLANVAGTSEANQSVMDAQVPQTAKVDRKNATAKITYDGEPQFEDIEGTNLRYAVNSPGSVLNSGKKYYYVDNGVWFEANSATGPWYAATRRPDEVEYIPARYPVYNVKYVYIYDVQPDYIYTGYTPGYLGTYIYGPTIVYGTGFYYNPWRGRHYYPRPLTWGFSMRYDPWIGWGFGVNLWSGWFSMKVGNYHHGNYWGGWWGPSAYRPFYNRPYDNYYGRNRYVNHYSYNNYRSVNIYNNRRNVVTHDRPRYSNTRTPGNSGNYSGNFGGRPGPVYSSRNGDRIGNRPPTANNNNTGRGTRNYEPNNVRGREPFSNHVPGNGNNLPGSNTESRPANPRGYRPGRENTTVNPGGNGTLPGNREPRPANSGRNLPQRGNNDASANPGFNNRNFSGPREARPAQADTRAPQQRDNSGSANPGFNNRNFSSPREARPAQPESRAPQRRENSFGNRGQENRSSAPSPSSGGSQRERVTIPGNGPSRPTREASVPRQSEHRSGGDGQGAERGGGNGSGRRSRGE